MAELTSFLRFQVGQQVVDEIRREALDEAGNPVELWRAKAKVRLALIDTTTFRYPDTYNLERLTCDLIIYGTHSALEHEQVVSQWQPRKCRTKLASYFSEIQSVVADCNGTPQVGASTNNPFCLRFSREFFLTRQTRQTNENFFLSFTRPFSLSPRQRLANI